jgi:hypothetical protein
LANKENIAAASKVYREPHREHIAAVHKEYEINNREKLNAKSRERNTPARLAWEALKAAGKLPNLWEEKEAGGEIPIES